MNQTETTHHESRHGAAGDGSRFLCFSLGGEEYAIPLLSVKEVIAPPEITPVPQSPSHFLGIMNLRGQIISVVDMRLKLGMKPGSGGETAIIICDVEPNPIGIMVDSIDSVYAPTADEASPKPELGTQKSSEHVIGVFRREDRLILLLDVARALDAKRNAAAA